MRCVVTEERKSNEVERRRREREVVQDIAVKSVRHEMMIHEVVRLVLIVEDMQVVSMSDCHCLDRKVYIHTRF